MKLRAVLMAMICLVGVSLFAQETVTRDWTATRQPREEGRPLPSGDAGGFTLMDRNTTPLSLGIIAPVQLPWGDWDVRGLRISLIYGQCVNMTGLDVGIWNGVDKDTIGIQMGAVNTASRMRGIQVGLFNCAHYLKGLQVGVVNYAEGARGVQIGLVNVITTTPCGWWPLLYGAF